MGISSASTQQAPIRPTFGGSSTDQWGAERLLTARGGREERDHLRRPLNCRPLVIATASATTAVTMTALNHRLLEKHDEPLSHPPGAFPRPCQKIVVRSINGGPGVGNAKHAAIAQHTSSTRDSKQALGQGRLCPTANRCEAPPPPEDAAYGRETEHCVALHPRI